MPIEALYQVIADLLKVNFFVWSKFGLVKFCADFCAEIDIKTYKIWKLCQIVPIIWRTKKYVFWKFHVQQYTKFVHDFFLLCRLTLKAEQLTLNSPVVWQGECFTPQFPLSSNGLIWHQWGCFWIPGPGSC